MADSNLEPIATPMRLHLARMRYQFMPVLIFVVALSLTGLLWKNYTGASNGTGEVSATTVRLVATQDGTVADSVGYPRLYDHVTRGQPLVRIDGKQSVELTAPVTGMVTAIQHQPGEFVTQGLEILSITEDTGAYIVSYIRPGSPIIPQKNMKVVVRGQDRRKWAECRVQEVGTRVVRIPDHQLANVNTPH